MRTIDRLKRSGAWVAVDLVAAGSLAYWASTQEGTALRAVDAAFSALWLVWAVVDYRRWRRG